MGGESYAWVVITNEILNKSWMGKRNSRFTFIQIERNFFRPFKIFYRKFGFFKNIADCMYQVMVQLVIHVTYPKTHSVKNGKILNQMLIVWKVLDGGKNLNSHL